MSEPAPLEHDARRRRHAQLGAALDALEDSPLREQLDVATGGSGIGGAHSVIDVDLGVPVFVKRVPLTALELAYEPFASTRNHYDLPARCHYGVGSPGFGAWRELAANQMATRWVLEGEGALHSFPALYHWRVLHYESTQPLHQELADVDGMIERWGDEPSIRRRLDALARSRASLALFFEYIPTTLPQWLDAQLAKGETAATAALEMVERGLREDLAAMNARGLFHFDAHLSNILTDGHRLYFADLGLACSPDFELSPDERAFVEANLIHDPCHALTRLVDWLTTRLTGVQGWRARNAFIRDVATGARSLDGVLPAAAKLIERYAPLAVLINAFYVELHGGAQRAAFPTSAVLATCDAIGLEALPPPKNNVISNR